MSHNNLALVSMALTGDAAGGLTAKNTPALGDNTKYVATMEAVQAALRNRRTITGNVTLAYADHGLLLVDASSGNIVITLPAATVSVTYKMRRIDSSNNSVTINRAGSDTIEGGTSVTLVGSAGYRELISDGTSKWYSSAVQEQGTFTPTARGTGATGTFTYSAQSGYWQRLGDRVFFSMNIGWTASTGTGSLRIKLDAIPYAARTGQQVPISVRVDSLTVGTGKQLQGYVNPTLSEINLEAADLAGAGTADVTVDTSVGQLMFAGSFLIA